MKHTTNNPLMNINDKLLHINVDPNKGETCFVEILERIENQMTAALSRHNRILVVRQDLHMAGYTQDNEIISIFLRSFKKVLVRKYKLTYIGHIWVREKESVDNQHYHLAMLIDGNRVQHPEIFIERAEELWQSMGHPKPYTPPNCFTMVARGNKAAFVEAFYRLSYFAKTRGKGRRNKTANDYGSSRIKAKISNETN